MPIIKNSNVETPAPSSNYYGAAQDVSKAIWKNTVSLKANNEFAIFDFLVERDQGDGSYYHAVPAKSERTGRDFTRQVYCNEKNVSTEGRLIEEDCSICREPATEEQRPPRMRYLYWVLHYGTYHLPSNPDLQAQRPWTQSWSQVSLGKQVFFRETVLRPQLLMLSNRTYSSVEQIDQRKGTILNTADAPAHFEFRRSLQSSGGGGRGMVSYEVLTSDVKLPDLSEEVAQVVDDLPKLDYIAAELITEVDLPQFGTPEVTEVQEETADAFERIANIGEGESF